MPVDHKHCRQVFEKLDKQLQKAEKPMGAGGVHKLRTGTRRVETVLGELAPQPDRQTRKLLKSLHRVRRKAGKVRDLDVQGALLRNLKLAGGAGEKPQLLRAMNVEREKREKKLFAFLDRDTVKDLRRRLKRAAGDIQIPEGLEPATVALHQFSELSRSHPGLTPAVLHQYRIAGKRSRYLLQMAEQTPEIESLAKQFEKLQDVVGDWHDWLTLTERAENMFGSVKQSPLVAAMRNLTRAKFRESVDLVMKTRSALSAQSATSIVSAQPGKKIPSVRQIHPKNPPSSAAA